MSFSARLRAWGRRLKREVTVVAAAIGDPRVPWHARLVAACVVAYALSPIDLIPDPIPILGYLDDLIVVPLGIAFVVRLIPPAVLADLRRRAANAAPRSRLARFGAIAVVLVWLLLAGVAAIAGHHIVNP